MIIYSCFGIQHRSVIQICLQWYQLEGAVWMSECVCVCVYAFNGSDQFCSTLADSQQVHTHTHARARALSNFSSVPSVRINNTEASGLRVRILHLKSGFLDMNLWKCNLSRTGLWSFNSFRNMDTSVQKRLSPDSVFDRSRKALVLSG